MSNERSDTRVSGCRKRATEHADPLLQAWLSGHELAAGKIEILESELSESPADLPLRMSVIGYYGKQQFRSPDARAALCAHLRWLIKHSEVNTLLTWLLLAQFGASCTPKQFGLMREDFLEQITNQPTNSDLIGYAGCFLMWRDYERGSELLERAMRLDPEDDMWPGRLCLFSYFEFIGALNLYKQYFAERCLHFGKIELQLRNAPPRMSHRYMAESALYLSQLDLAVRYARQLAKDGSPLYEQTANAILGRIALRKGNVPKAIHYLQIQKPGYHNLCATWELATELLKRAENDAVIATINSYKGIVAKRLRNKWIEEINAGRIPRFESCGSL
jgi:hypothetical protein